MPIKRLSVQLANQIAAGEVVERPSSVVKELMENAIDAEATSITLEIAKAGKSLIKVTDNGSGIPKDELVLALAPHATSKIAKLEDLDAIYTLGFRGEALASIASVSKLTLISCTQDQDHAYQVEVSGPEQNPDVQPAAHPVGTSVVVRELFFNTPARRRFLKSDKTEFNHIKELFTRLALVNFEVEFKFIADGKLVIHVPAIKKADISQRIGKLLGLEFKRDGMYFDSSQRKQENSQNSSASLAVVDLSSHALAKANAQSLTSSDKVAAETEKSREESGELLSFDLNDKVEPVVKLYGVILPPPSLSQSLPDRLLTFLNGRMIADKTVNHAIKEGYMESVLKPNDSFKPSVRAVIFLECDPHIVDVNVHPRKDEVRFHNSNLVHDCIKQEIMSVLDAYGLNDESAKQGVLAPSLVVDREKLETKLERKPNAVEQAQQRLATWQQQDVQVRKSYEYGDHVFRNHVLQDVIFHYLERTPQALRASPQENVVLLGRLCDLSKVRTTLVELEARKQAQQAYNYYHQSIFGEQARVTQHTQDFMEHAHPILKSDLEAQKAQAEHLEQQLLAAAEQEMRDALDEQGWLRNAFSLDDHFGPTAPNAQLSSAAQTSSDSSSLQSQSSDLSLIASRLAQNEALAEVMYEKNHVQETHGEQGESTTKPGEEEMVEFAASEQSPQPRSQPSAGMATLSSFSYRQAGATGVTGITGAIGAVSDNLLLPQSDSTRELFENLDPKMFLGSGLGGSTGKVHAEVHSLEQRYNQHMLGMRALETSVLPDVTKHQAQCNNQAQSQVQSQIQGQGIVSSLSELMVPAGTGSAFNKAFRATKDIDLQISSTLLDSAVDIAKENFFAPLHLATPGTDTLEPESRGVFYENEEGNLIPGLPEILTLTPASNEWTSEKLKVALASYPSDDSQSLSKLGVYDPEAAGLSVGSGPAGGNHAETNQGRANQPEATPAEANQLASNTELEEYRPQSQFLSLIAHDVILFMLEHRYYVGRGSELYYSFAARNYVRQVQGNAVERFTLQMNFAIKCEPKLLQSLKQELVQYAVKRCGFELEVNPMRGCIELSKIPLLLVSSDLARIVPLILEKIAQDAEMITMGECKLELGQEIARARKFEITSEADALFLLSKIDSIELLRNVRSSSDIKELKLLNLALSMLQDGK